MSTDTSLTEELAVVFSALMAGKIDGHGALGSAVAAVERIIAARLAELWDARDDLGARLTQAEYLRDEAEAALADFAERAAEAIEACICNTGPGTDGPSQECARHGEEVAVYYLSFAASVVRELGRTEGS